MPDRQGASGGGVIVLCPMEIERAAVARALARAGMADAEVIRTGIGKDAILAAIDPLAARSPRPTLVLLAGACGGLTWCDDVPAIARIVDESGRCWRRFVGADPAGVTLVATDRIISSPAEKASLSRRCSASIVDMESHAFAERCEARGLTWGIVRGVSDAPDESLPGEVLTWIAPDGRTRTMRAAADMLRRPRLIPPMLRVLRRSRRVLPAVGRRVVATIAGMNNRLLPEAITPLPIPDNGVKAVVLFGGSFDPPHRAHVEVPIAARQALARQIGAEPSEVWLVYVPAARSPHKDDPPLAAPTQRVEMLRLALADVPSASVWTDELDRAAGRDGRACPSYSVDTARHARGWLDYHDRGGVALRWLMGADQAGALHRWREPRALMALAEPLIVLRPPIETAESVQVALARSGFWSEEELAAFAGRFVEAPLLEIASTQVRRSLARGQTPSGAALDPRVIDFIRRHGLYRAGSE